MKVGTIVLSTHQGLGVLARSFYDGGILDEVLVKRSSRFENHPEWFGDAPLVGDSNDFASNFSAEDIPTVLSFLEKIDVLLLFELPFVSQLVDLARERGIKVAMMPMYECTPYPTFADLYICPSVLDEDYYKQMYPEANVVQINVPVDIPWRLRKTVKTFVHNAGNGGTYGRNGTAELLHAMKHVKSPIELILRTQKDSFKTDDPRIELITDTVGYEELWNRGDAFIFPEKFNGLSLPLQEAHACGMLVVTGARRPNNIWLPKEPLIPVHSVSTTRIVNVNFEMSEFDPKVIAEKIDYWYGRDIENFSLAGKKWAEENSWYSLRAVYLEALRSIK